MTFNPTPKAEFQATPKNLEDHHVIVQNPIVRRAIEVTLAQMQRLIADNTPPDMGACAAAHLRMLGAQDFVQTFYTLAETAAPVARSDAGNLPGNVRQMPRQGKN